MSSVGEHTLQLQPTQRSDVLRELERRLAWLDACPLESGVDLDQHRNLGARFARCFGDALRSPKTVDANRHARPALQLGQAPPFRLADHLVGDE